MIDCLRGESSSGEEGRRGPLLGTPWEGIASPVPTPARCAPGATEHSRPASLAVTYISSGVLAFVAGYLTGGDRMSRSPPQAQISDAVSPPAVGGQVAPRRATPGPFPCPHLWPHRSAD